MNHHLALRSNEVGVGALSSLTTPVTPDPMSPTKIVIGLVAATAVIVGLFYLFPAKETKSHRVRQ